jgi:predicted nucleic acid-binding protein
VEVVPSELEIGRARGHTHADRLRELVEKALIEIVRLRDDGMRAFETLVVGPAAVTLDDGEAGTIAYAIEHSAVALIDERKAARICAERYPALRIACTVDVLTHPDIALHLGQDKLAEAVYAALRVGRMRVLPHHLDLVLALIGPEGAAACPSLPRAVRLHSRQRTV